MMNQQLIGVSCMVIIAGLYLNCVGAIREDPLESKFESAFDVMGIDKVEKLIELMQKISLSTPEQPKPLNYPVSNSQLKEGIVAFLETEISRDQIEKDYNNECKARAQSLCKSFESALGDWNIQLIDLQTKLHSRAQPLSLVTEFWIARWRACQQIIDGNVCSELRTK